MDLLQSATGALQGRARMREEIDIMELTNRRRREREATFIVEQYPSTVGKALRAQSGGTARQPIPFSQRRVIAEWLLQHGACINEVTRNRSRGLSWPDPTWVDEMLFSLACCAGDWEFAEWLVENGAYPGLPGGQALPQLWWAFPYYGKKDPSVAKEIAEG